ncbi:hypothetical protein OU997_05220 [Pseudomonas sp. SL4(2022)]|uniref:hypothetical protein n=1 Tax=Pseudomonas sp. SL4(2022) TaxID=2994661 RepID=UPI00227008DC|nr:hypothetical protein [Pseudomonas sp. SL4(2022)]WAC45573.1 hypothetical protein OU997_05220 [Pseudomonas sp. SL4(2022)]
MLINGGPLNGAPLNGGIAGGAAPPVYVVAGTGYLWRERVLVGGTDISDQLVEGWDSDREEGAAGVGSIAFYLPPGPVTPSDWVGRDVTIDYISTSAGLTTEDRVLTGKVVTPTWDPSSRVMVCELSDQLQQRTEAMSIAEIDALTEGDWSADVFDPVEGRSRWEYAQERMSTRTASLDCSAYGVPRVTSWYAAAPAFVFGPGQVLDGTQGFEPVDLSRMTNKVVIEADYRYARLRQRNEYFSWVGGGFCDWYFSNSKELPTVEMVQEAVSSAGGNLLAGYTWDLLPPTSPNPCLIGVPWINSYGDEELLLSASFGMGRRWAQSVTERNVLSVEVPTSIAAAGAVIERTGGALEIESLLAETWGDTPFTDGFSSHTDERDEPRRVLYLVVQLLQGVAIVVRSHRGTTVTWQVPASMAMGIDLTHTLELNDLIRARGKCVRIATRADYQAGTAITTLTIAIMRGGGDVADPLTPPASVDEPQPPPIPTPTILPTQLGKRPTSPPYDDELPGFAGNYSVGVGIEYPRRFDIDAAEIAAEQRDELVVPIERIYRVPIPNDLLEL